MKKKRLPESLEQFVKQQKTRPVADLWEHDSKEDRLPYGQPWYRAVACLLLSGRIQAKRDGAPNMTDVNRVGKEANFNQYLTERVAKFLVAMDAIAVDRQDRYVMGPEWATFWDHDVKRLQGATQRGVLRLALHPTDPYYLSSRRVDDAYPIEFLSLFFTSFQGLGLVDSRVGQALHDFSLLPQDDLVQAAQTLGLLKGDVDFARWTKQLDEEGQKHLIAALAITEWAYSAEHAKTNWVFASPTGLAMLGLEKAPPAPELATEFTVGADLSVSAGAGLAWEKLVPLFRYAKIKRIGEVCKFQLDRKRLAEFPSPSAPGEELREVLRELEPLPSTVVDLLATKPKTGGRIAIRWCSALIEPESEEVLKAIRTHPKLKGYLEPGAPPGYLLIKERSNSDNFVQRCQDLGFTVFKA